MLTGRVFDRGELLARILSVFSGLYERWEGEGFGSMSFEMERRLLWKGLPVRVETGGGIVHGVIAGVTAGGCLRLLSDGKEEVCASGDVSLVRTEGDPECPPGLPGKG
jgi:biotin-(acetyl-CoA carboxylase) ligase